jgi:hypothetical protein
LAGGRRAYLTLLDEFGLAARAVLDYERAMLVNPVPLS